MTPRNFLEAVESHGTDYILAGTNPIANLGIQAFGTVRTHICVIQATPLWYLLQYLQETSMRCKPVLRIAQSQGEKWWWGAIQALVSQFGDDSEWCQGSFQFLVGR